MKKLTLVKYNYEGLNIPKHDEKIFSTFQFCYLGEIPNMPGHCYVQDIKTGKPYIFHTESMIPLTDEEL